MAEVLDTNLLPPLLSVRADGAAMPINRQDVDKVLAVKVNEQELAKIKKFAEYLKARGYTKDSTFASLFVYMFNKIFELHADEAKREALNG